jgi:hypothetical protein
MGILNRGPIQQREGHNEQVNHVLAFLYQWTYLESSVSSGATAAAAGGISPLFVAAATLIHCRRRRSANLHMFQIPTCQRWRVPPATSSMSSVKKRGAAADRD